MQAVYPQPGPQEAVVPEDGAGDGAGEGVGDG